MKRPKHKKKSLKVKPQVFAVLLAFLGLTPCSLSAQSGSFTYQPYENNVEGGFTHQGFGNGLEGGFTHQGFGNGLEGGFMHQGFGNGPEGGFTHQGFGNDIEGGFTHQPFGNDAPLGSGLLVLLSAGVGYAAMKKKRYNKK